MKKSIKLLAGLVCALLLGVFLTACGGAPNLTIDRAGITNVVATANVQENEIGQITEPGFSGQNLPSFTATLTKGTIDYSHVRILVDTDESIQIIAKDTNNNYYNVVKSGWGPAEGFELADTATTTFYVVASTPGNYAVTSKVIDVSNNDAVLVFRTEMINVVEAE